MESTKNNPQTNHNDSLRPFEDLLRPSNALCSLHTHLPHMQAEPASVVHFYDCYHTCTFAVFGQPAGPACLDISVLV